MGNIISMSMPNCVITVADRHETLSSAIAASYMNIPLIHLQGVNYRVNRRQGKKCNSAVIRLSFCMH